MVAKKEGESHKVRKGYAMVMAVIRVIGLLHF